MDLPGSKPHAFPLPQASLTRGSFPALTAMTCQTMSCGQDCSALGWIQGVFPYGQGDGGRREVDTTKWHRSPTPRPRQNAVVPGSCCRDSSEVSSSWHPPRGKGSWVYFLFLHSWLINMKKSCPLLINFVFHDDNVLMKLNIYSSKARVELLSQSDGSPCRPLQRFRIV